ncbi:hypothetical protein LZC95_15490 [Pendulispora brunnea]|uniref:Uncharacterized protein n=1 Tax=Pendulispora brunnea TaxID=2905690 RepID=A0ABZ2KHR6_9BACT
MRLRDGVPETMRTTPEDVVSGTGSNDLWFGYGSKTTHWDGSKFTDFAIPDDGSAVSLDATGERPWLVASHSGQTPRDPGHRVLYSFSNERWVSGQGFFDPRSVRVFPSNEVWISAFGGVGKLGSQLMQTDVPFFSYGALHGASSTDFWVLGHDDSSKTTMLHSDGVSLRPYAYPGASLPASIFIGGPGWGFIGDERGELLGLRGESFVPVTRPPVPHVVRYAVGGAWGTGPNDIYAVGQLTAPSWHGAAIHWDGCRWKEVDFGFGPLGKLSDVWGIGNEIWVLGEDPWILGQEQKGFLLHKDAAGKWNRLATPQDAGYESVWGTAPNDVWFGGPTFMHWDGSTFTTVPQPPGLPPYPALDDMTGSAPDDIWALYHGDIAPLFHYDGRVWTRQLEQFIDVIVSVAKDDAWAWSNHRHTLLHFDGRKWTPVDLPNGAPNIYAMWANAANDVWFGEHLHWDGTAVRAVRGDADASQMWGDGKNTWALTGRGGILVHRAPSSTSR